MAKPYKSLREKMSPAARAESEARTRRMLAEMPLNELREARHLTQENLAEILNVNQAAVSKIESRVDMYVSTLRRFIEAMGGQLVICADFPEGSIRITQFEELDSLHAEGGRGQRVRGTM